MTNHVKITLKELFKWFTLKLIEISFGNQLTVLFENESGTVQENHEPVKVSNSAFDDQSTDIPDNTSFFPDDVEVFPITPLKLFLENSIASLKELKIPSFSATNYVLRKDINLGKTNIFKTPLIPGPV